MSVDLSEVATLLQIVESSGRIGEKLGSIHADAMARLVAIDSDLYDEQMKAQADAQALAAAEKAQQERDKDIAKAQEKLRAKEEEEAKLRARANPTVAGAPRGSVIPPPTAARPLTQPGPERRPA